ncbi:MAG: IS5/IS1182 family transposase, partial [Richelia sp.]|nr:IS5/IS1182 family transposase [Richelia sp.]
WILQILQFLSHIHERAYGNHPLTAKQKEDNRERSQVKAKKATIGLNNLVYNFKRYAFWENQNPKAVG